MLSSGIRLTGALSERPIPRRRPGYREEQVFALLHAELVNGGRAPSHRQVAERIGISAPHSCHVMGRLERRGWIYRIGEGRQRRVCLTLAGLIAGGLRGLSPLIALHAQEPEALLRGTIRASRQ